MVKRSRGRQAVPVRLVVLVGVLGLGGMFSPHMDAASAAQQPANSPIVLFWELPLRDSDGVASGVTGAQGWAFSTAGAITKVELFVDGVSEGELPCCSPRKDVMDAIDEAPLRTGFNGVVSWGRFPPGIHTMKLAVTDSDGNKLTETRKVRTVKILPGVGLARDLSLLDADCQVTGAGELTCTGVDFDQGPCAGEVKFRWLNARQGFEAVQGCAVGGSTPTPVKTPSPTPKPTPKPTVAAPTPTPGPTGSGVVADCTNPAVCPGGCVAEPILSGFALFNIVLAPGEQRTYCAPVMPPYVNFHPDKIKFQFYDQSDTGCALVFVEIEQTTGALLTVDSGIFSPDGTLNFTSQFGPSYFPERTQPGIYKIHLTGGGGCEPNPVAFRLSWEAD